MKKIFIITLIALFGAHTGGLSQVIDVDSTSLPDKGGPLSPSITDTELASVDTLGGLMSDTVGLNKAIPKSDSIKVAAFCNLTFIKLDEYWSEIAHYSGTDRERIIRKEKTYRSEFYEWFFTDSTYIDGDLAPDQRAFFPATTEVLPSYLVDYRIMLDKGVIDSMVLDSPEVIGVFARDNYVICIIKYDKIFYSYAGVDKVQRMMFVETKRINDPNQYKIYKIRTVKDSWERPPRLNPVVFAEVARTLTITSPDEGYNFNPYLSHEIEWENSINEPIILEFRTSRNNFVNKPQAGDLIDRFVANPEDRSFTWTPSFSVDSIELLQKYPISLTIYSDRVDTVRSTLYACGFSPPFMTTVRPKQIGSVFPGYPVIEWTLTPKFLKKIGPKETIVIDLMQNGKEVMSISEGTSIVSKRAQKRHQKYSGSFEWEEIPLPLISQADKDSLSRYQIRIALKRDPKNMLAYSDEFDIPSIIYGTQADSELKDEDTKKIISFLEKIGINLK